MLREQKNTTPAPVRAVVPLLATAALLVMSMAPAAAQSLAQRKRQATEQFERAQKQRSALEAKPDARRSLSEYLAAVDSFRRVYRITPHALEATAALMAVGELYEAMGRLHDRKYYQSAIDAYQFLIHEYPGSKHRPEAWLRVGQLQLETLGQLDAAELTYEGYLKEYRHTVQAAQAQQALRKISDSRTAQQRERARREVAQHNGPMPLVTGIRYWNFENHTRVVVDLSGEVQFQSERIPNPDRIYFDLYPARLSSAVSERSTEIPGGFLKRIRVAPNQLGVVRVVLDVERVQDYSVFLLEEPFRLVVDAYGQSVQLAQKPAAGEIQAATERPDAESKPAKEAAIAAATAPGKTPDPTSRGGYNMTRALGVKVSRIVIDAGHGGHDTGAIGPSGLLEKDLCLDLALRLGKMIQEKLPGAEVIYTRTSDVFISLERRTEIANEARADMFISIHANSNRDRRMRGVETYYLSFATSSDALEVAAQENRMNQASLHEMQELMSKIANNEKMEESRELATAVQTALAERLQRYSRYVRDRGVRKAPFVVLIGAKMPSVLAEVSYLSNPTDEKILKRDDHRDRIVEGLFNGVQNYLEGLNSLATLSAKRELADGSN